MNQLTLRASHSMTDALLQAQEARSHVTLHLNNGRELTGKIADIADHAVLIATLAQKEFYDALVLTDAILAIEFRARSA